MEKFLWEKIAVEEPGFESGTLRSAALHSTNEKSDLGKVSSLVYVVIVLWLWPEVCW